MPTTQDLIRTINRFSLDQRLKIVEEVLRGIRKESAKPSENKSSGSDNLPQILEMAGTLTNEEAAVYKTAVDESRKIDHEGW